MTHPATTNHNDNLACRFCRHRVNIHNLSQGCPVEKCRCAGTPGEASPRTNAELDLLPISESQILPGHEVQDAATIKRQALAALGITPEQMESLSKICLDHLRPPNYSGGSWTLNPDALANAIVQHGWRPTR